MLSWLIAAMTSVISSIFSSANTVLTSRIEALKRAEDSLVDLARRRFGPDDLFHSIETFDTDIPRSAIPLDKTSGVKCQINTVAETDEHFVLHGVKVTRDDNKQQSTTGTNASPSLASPLVILHGYMNGSLYFYRNLLGLAQHFKAVYSLDQLGWGLSSRPSFDHVPSKESDTSCAVESSESFFVESLEQWRAANKIDKMNLCGHSMGGYLGVAYAERYPERVDNLILLSPVGVPDHDPTDDPLSRPDVPLRYKVLFGTFRFLWSRGTTPGSFARSYMPESKARNLIDRYVEGRLPSVTCPTERQVLGDYLFHSAMLPGSGEACLNRLLKPGAYARKPTVNRIPNLKVDRISIVYGQNDWMDPMGGLEVQRRCNEMRKTGISAPTVDVQGVRHAGHMLMIENWEETNSAIVLAAGGTPSKSAPLPGQFVDGQDTGFFRGSRFRKVQQVEGSDKDIAVTTDEPRAGGSDKPAPVVGPVGAS